MLVETGPAISFHTGSVFSTHSPRVIATGGAASSEMVVTSPSHRFARAKESAREDREPSAMPWPSRLAMWRACRSEFSHGSPPKAPWSCAMIVCIIAGSNVKPSIPWKAPRSASGSMSPPPWFESIRRRNSWKSSGFGSLSAMSLALSARLKPWHLR